MLMNSIHVFPEMVEYGIEWVVVKRCVDDTRLLFLVPLDRNPFVGTWDIAVSEFSEAGPGVLRCGRGTWIHIDHLRQGTLNGFLESDYVNEVNDRLSALVHNLVPVHKPDVDEHPEYQNWMDVVTTASDHLDYIYCTLDCNF